MAGVLCQHVGVTLLVPTELTIVHFLKTKFYFPGLFNMTYFSCSKTNYNLFCIFFCVSVTGLYFSL